MRSPEINFAVPPALPGIGLQGLRNSRARAIRSWVKTSSAGERDADNGSGRDLSIVLVHGGAQGAWVWNETIDALRAQGFRDSVIALDVPGCGTKRGRDTSGMDVLAVAAELSEELVGRDMSPSLLVGHSQGGTLLPWLTAQIPDRVAALCYVSCAAPLEGQTLREMMGHASRDLSGDVAVGFPLDPLTHELDEMFGLMFCNDMNAKDAERFLARLGQDSWPEATDSSDRHWGREHVASLQATYVVALQDEALPTRWQERFAERLNCTRLVRIDAGHQLMQTRPHALAEVLRAEHRKLSR